MINKKILIVEDDDLLRKIMVAQLAQQYRCLEAKDGRQALQTISDERPDLLVLDLILPNLDGFEVLKQLRALPDAQLAQLPVLVISNLSDQQHTDLAQNYNILEYYTKSDVEFGVILKRIDQILTAQN